VMADDGRTTLVELRAGSLFEDPRGTRWCLVADAVPSRAAAHLPAVCLDRTGRNNLPPDLRVRPLNLPALLKELHELRTLAHDLLIDRDAAYGREVGRGEALAAAEKWWEDVQDVDLEVGRLFDAIRGPTPVRPLPPPERLAARCRALETALRACVEQMNMVAHHPPDFAAAVEDARKLLGKFSVDE
jgi:hypothetical protein